MILITSTIFNHVSCILLTLEERDTPSSSSQAPEDLHNQQRDVPRSQEREGASPERVCVPAAIHTSVLPGYNPSEPPHGRAIVPETCREIRLHK